MTTEEEHMKEGYIKPVISVTCDIKATVHGFRPGCVQARLFETGAPISVHKSSNVLRDPYSGDDDMFYEDWSKDQDAVFGKPQPLNWWLMLIFVVVCVAGLWALHHYKQ